MRASKDTESRALMHRSDLVHEIHQASKTPPLVASRARGMVADFIVGNGSYL